jgi:AcrR family transcriptional regulator
MLSSSARRPARRAGTRDLRAAILTAARALCFAEGAAGVSARKVAARVGCSATTIYLYYRNLDDLLHHVRMEGHALLAAALRGAAPGSPALARVRAMGRAYHAFGRAHPHYYALMFTVDAARAPRRELVQHEMYTLMLLRDVLAGGVARGELRADLDVTVATNALWAQIHGVTALAVSGMLMQTAPGHDRDVLDAILDTAGRWLRS